MCVLHARDMYNTYVCVRVCFMCMLVLCTYTDEWHTSDKHYIMYFKTTTLIFCIWRMPLSLDTSWVSMSLTLAYTRTHTHTYTRTHTYDTHTHALTYTHAPTHSWHIHMGWWFRFPQHRTIWKFHVEWRGGGWDGLHLPSVLRRLGRGYS